jgi:hypothetical protein
VKEFSRIQHPAAGRLQSLAFGGVRARSQVRRISHGRFREDRSSFPPDNKFIAYRCNESGRFEIVAQALAPGGGRRKISIDDGAEPQDGKEIFFRSRDALMAVDIKAGGNGLTAVFRFPCLRLPWGADQNRYVATRDGVSWWW